ncbi:MAG TPA: hypothetical protein VNH46_02295 [Gemmatimonadales bacterium]|nr:hypothetical protein [Gemmatimonadales bacterium]
MTSGDGQLTPREFEICKVGGTGSFTWTVTDGSSGGPITLNAGDCQVIYSSSAYPVPLLTVTEQSAPGYQLDSIKIVHFGTTPGSSLLNPVTQVLTGTNSVTGPVGLEAGSLATFFNSEVPPPPPPPPPSGGQGCTPGYWKQTQHFDSWTAPYAPTMQFSAVFDNAFPGMTLVDVLGQGGGGLNALGRHTVAALLNAASPNVSYDLTTQQVIDQFNAVYPGSKGAYETLKDQFAGFNEQSCPLN